MTQKRIIPLPDPEPLSELISVEDVAKRWGKHPNTIRQWIDLDMADGAHRVPGGRRKGSSTVIIRSVFELAMRDGIEPTPRPVHIAPDVVQLVAELRSIAANLSRLADSLGDQSALSQDLPRAAVRKTG